MGQDLHEVYLPVDCNGGALEAPFPIFTRAFSNPGAMASYRFPSPHFQAKGCL